MEKIAREAELSVMKGPDPEGWFHLGELMGYCGQQDVAMRVLRAAIKQNYCGYEALQTDPLLAKLRGTSEFPELQSQDKKGQHVFRAAISESTMKDADPDIPILKQAKAEYVTLQ
jgi:hypothetical protein